MKEEMVFPLLFLKREKGENKQMALYKPKNLKPSLINGPINMDISKGGRFSFEIDGNEPINNFEVAITDEKGKVVAGPFSKGIDSKFQYYNTIIELEDVGESYTVDKDRHNGFEDTFVKEYPMFNTKENKTGVIEFKNLPENTDSIILDSIYYQVSNYIFVDSRAAVYNRPVNIDFILEKDNPTEYFLESFSEGEGFFGDEAPRFDDAKKDLLYQRRRACSFNKGIPLKLSKANEVYYVQLNSQNLYNNLDSIGKSHFMGETPFYPIRHGGGLFRAFDWIFLKFKCSKNTLNNKNEEDKIKFYIIKGFIPNLSLYLNDKTHIEKYFFPEPDYIYKLKDMSSKNMKKAFLRTKQGLFLPDYDSNEDYFDFVDPDDSWIELQQSYIKTFFGVGIEDKPFYLPPLNKETSLFTIPTNAPITVPRDFLKSEYSFPDSGELISVKPKENINLGYPIDSKGDNRTFFIDIPSSGNFSDSKLLKWSVKINDSVESNAETFYNSSDLGLTITNIANNYPINKNIPINLTIFDQTKLSSGSAILGRYKDYNENQMGYNLMIAPSVQTIKEWEGSDASIKEELPDRTYYKFYPTKSSKDLTPNINNNSFYYLPADVYENILKLKADMKNSYIKSFSMYSGDDGFFEGVVDVQYNYSFEFYTLGDIVNNDEQKDNYYVYYRYKDSEETKYKKEYLWDKSMALFIRGTEYLPSSNFWPNSNWFTLETFADADVEEGGNGGKPNSFIKYPEYKEISNYSYKLTNIKNNKVLYQTDDVYTADLNFQIPFLRNGDYRLDASVTNTLGMKTSNYQNFSIKTETDDISARKVNVTKLKDSGIHIDWSSVPFLYANFSKGSPQDEDFYYNYPSPMYIEDEDGNRVPSNSVLKSYVIPTSYNVNFNLLGQSCEYLAYCFQPIGQEFGIDTTRKVMTLYGGNYKYEFSTCLIDSSDLTLNIKCYNINTGEQISPSNNEGDESFIKINLPNNIKPFVKYSDQLYYIFLLDKTKREMYFKIYYNENVSNILNNEAVDEINFDWKFVEAEFAEDSSTALKIPESREWYSIFEPIQITLEENQVVSYLIGTNQELGIDGLELWSARDYIDDSDDLFSFNPNRDIVEYIAENRSQEEISSATVVRVDLTNDNYKVVYDKNSYINNFIDYSAPNNIECFYEVYLGNGTKSPYVTPTFNTEDLGKWFLIVADDYFGPTGYDENKVIVSDIFEFEANIKYGAMNTNTDYSISKNFTKYPKVQKSYSNYWSGTLSGLLGVMADGGRYIQTIDMLNKFKQLSTDPRRKFLKDREGNLWEVEISASNSIETNANLDIQLRTKTINWVEIADVANTMIFLEDYSQAAWLKEQIPDSIANLGTGRTQF